MDAAEPDVADSQTDDAGGGVPPPRRRRKWGWFAKVSVTASILTTVLALAFAVWLQRTVQSDGTAGPGYGTEQSIRSTTTTTATVPRGAAYIVLESTAKTVTRWDQAVIAGLTKERLARYGFPGVEAQCVGIAVVVTVPPMSEERMKTAFELIVSQPGVEVQSTTSTPPDTTGNLVGCEFE